MKLAPLLFVLLLLTACRSHKATTDVATASTITARDTSHRVTTARQTADTASTLCILSVDSLTLSRLAADVVPDSVVLRAIAEHAAAAERSDSPVLPAAAAVHTLRVYGLRLAVSTATARRTTADSVAAATKTDVTEQLATHATAKTITPAAPRLTTPLLLLFVIAALLLAAAYWWKRKQAANN